MTSVTRLFAHLVRDKVQVLHYHLVTVVLWDRDMSHWELENSWINSASWSLEGPPLPSYKQGNHTNLVLPFIMSLLFCKFWT